MPRKRRKNARKVKYLAWGSGVRGGQSTPMIVRNVPPELRKRFKKWCKENGYTMAGKLRKVMDDLCKGRTF